MLVLPVGLCGAVHSATTSWVLLCAWPRGRGNEAALEELALRFRAQETE